MTESKLWDELKSAVEVFDPKADLSRHEDRLSPGTPDVSYTIRGVSGWAELKAVARLPRSMSVPVVRNIRPSQVRWILKRVRAGGICCVLIRVESPRLYIWVWGGDVGLIGSWTRSDLVKLGRISTRTTLDLILPRLIRRPEAPQT